MSEERPKSAVEGATAMGRKAIAAFRALGKPAKVLFVTTLVAALGLAAWFGERAANPAFAPLYASLPADDASAVAAKLKELKIPFRVVEGGRVEVPEARVPELRLEMAGAGLPRGGAVGFEMFDKTRLGATEFEQKILYRRALEGEIVRTVGSMAAIESVRVHLVMPERSVFVSRREPGSASVVLKVRNGQVMTPAEVGAIVHLVASAVPGLGAGNVTVATTDGALLRKPRGEGDGDMVDDDAAGEVKAMEATLEARARDMVERVVGPGHADVRVSVDMDFARVERQTETFEPATRALRSEELTVEKAATGDGDVTGVPGAESNLPDGEPETTGLGDPAAGPGVVRHQHTRNYEVSRVSEKRVSRTGKIQRLTVAVLLDGVVGEDGTAVPRDPEQIEQLASLVRTAVGASDERADLITVESMPFAASIAELDDSATPATPASPLDALPQGVRRVLPFAVGGVLALFLLIAVLVVRRRRRRRAKAAETALALRASDQLSAPDAMLQLNPRDEALRIATEDPATAALIMREWLGAAAASDAARAA